MRTRSYARRVILSIVLLLTGVAVMPATAGAELTQDPLNNFWGVDGLEDDSGPRIPDAEVWAIEQVGNTMYVGGRFLTVQGGPDRYDQSFLAAFHADTGRWIDWWRPELDGAVWSIEASEDGSRLFVGGRFETVNGRNVPSFAVIDPASGELDLSWTTRASGGGPASMRIVHLDEDGWLYLGGNYSTIAENGVARPAAGIARVNPVTGAVDNNWQPTVQGNAIYGIDVDIARDRVYFAGLFDSVNDAPDSRYFAIVNSSDGQTTAVNNPFPMPSPEGRYNTSRHHDVIVTGDKVFVAGTEHTLWVLNADDLSVHGWHYTGFAGDRLAGGGDFQALEQIGNRIYASCHCGVSHRSSYTGGFGGTITPVRFLIAVDATTGEFIPSYQAGFSASAGPWAMKAHSTDGCLWSGGDMRTSNGRPVYSLVRQCDNGVPGPAAGSPLTQPGIDAVVPASCEAQPTSDDTINVSWVPATDDNADRYVIRRSRDGGAFSWAGAVDAPTTSWDNSGVSAGTYAYRVETRAANGSVASVDCDPAGGVVLDNSVIAPSACAASVSGNLATITWTRATGDNAARFIVRRSRDGGAFFWAGSVAAPGVSFDNSIGADGTYQYQIEAVGFDNSRALIACSPTDGIVVGGGGGNVALAPLACSAVLSGNEVLVTWDRAPADQAVRFVVRRGRNGGTPGWAGSVAAPLEQFTNTLTQAGSYAYSVETIAADNSRAVVACSPAVDLL